MTPVFVENTIEMRRSRFASPSARRGTCATIETRTPMAMLALDNVEAVLKGGLAPTLVPNRSPEIV
jgi:hypothetical protein